MAYNQPRSSGGDTSNGYQLPISRSFAVAVLVALVVLFALRHLFGSIRIEGGTK